MLLWPFFRDGNKISSRFAVRYGQTSRFHKRSLTTLGRIDNKPVQPSTATSAWLLTREGCNYTHLAGEHSTTIRKSSPKPVRFFLGPPTYFLLHFSDSSKNCNIMLNNLFILKFIVQVVFRQCTPKKPKCLASFMMQKATHRT